MQEWTLWLDEVKATTSHQNWRQNEGYSRLRIAPVVGGKKISRLTEQDLQTVITKAYAAGLAHKTLCNIRASIGAFLRYCRKAHYTTLNPESLTIPRGAKKSEKRILQPDSVKILFSKEETTYRKKVKKDWFIHAYRFAVCTGLRPGELIALEWKNIRNGIVSTKGAINHTGERTQGKNDNARRTFALSDISARVLEDQKAMLKAHGIISPYVFPRQDGDYTRQLAYERAWKRYSEHNGLEKVTPYELRHTFVSIAKEMPDALLKSIVGHSKNMDTQGVYGHRVKGELERTAGLVDEAFAFLKE